MANLDTLEAAEETIRHIEVKHDLLQYRIDGWCVWPLLRFPAAMSMIQASFSRQPQLSRLDMISAALMDLHVLVRPRRARFVVSVVSTARAESQSGKLKDIYFDDLLLELGECFKIERLNRSRFMSRNKAALIKSDITSAAFDLLTGRAIKQLSAPRHIVDTARRLSACFEQEGLKVFTIQRVTHDLLRFYWGKKLCSWFLRRVNATHFFSADGYSEHDIIAAAKEAGLKVVEFQHGILYRYHPGYSWSTYALPYKESMPIADRLFLYGQYWKQQLEANGFWGERLCVVGSLRLDYHRQRKLTHLRHSRKPQLTLMLTTDGQEPGSLNAFICEFLKIAGSKLNFRLCIKLHPREVDKSVYEQVFKAYGNVQVVAASESPSTFDLLSEADLHLSIVSTCHYEAIGLGVPTVILAFPYHETLLHLYRAGHALLASTPQELLQLLLDWNGRDVPDEIGRFYFEPGALHNMKEELGV